MSSKIEKVTFKNSSGHAIDARLELPENGPEAFAIFAHCFTCSKDVHAATRISRNLTRAGIAVLRFDFTGLGNSDGDFSHTNFSTNVSDLVSAAEYLARNQQAPKLLIGHSLGGAAVLAAAGELSSAEAVFTIAAPADVDHLERLFKGKIPEIERDGEAQVSLAGRSFTIRKQFLDDVRSIVLQDKIRALKASLMVFHSPEDEVVTYDHAVTIFGQAPHPKSLVSLPGAGHLLNRPQDSEFVGHVIGSWCARYIIGKDLFHN